MSLSDKSIFHHLRRAPGRDLIDRVFEALFHVVQLFPDGDVLGAVLLALAALHAQARVAAHLSQGGAHQVFPHTGGEAVGIAGIVGGNKQEALEHFRRAAENGNEDAAKNLKEIERTLNRE